MEVAVLMMMVGMVWQWFPKFLVTIFLFLESSINFLHKTVLLPLRLCISIALTMKNPNIQINAFKSRFSGNYLHLGNHCGVVLYGIEIPKRIWRHYLQDSPSYGIYDTTSRDSFISDKAKQVARGSDFYSVSFYVYFLGQFFIEK